MTPPAVFFLSLLGMEALHMALPGPRVLEGAGVLPGLALIVGGIWLHASGYRTFRRRDTTVATLARPRVLVTDGPFRISRNPMYTAGILILLGAALVMGSTTPLLVPLVFGVLVHRLYIVKEEALLEGEFGPGYRRYAESVPRWL